MKKIILSLAIVLISIASTFAQDSVKVYCEIIGTPISTFAPTNGNLNVYVTFDFGQKQDGSIVDERGRLIIFNSIVDAMNLMSQNGWSFVQAVDYNLKVYHP